MKHRKQLIVLSLLMLLFSAIMLVGCMPYYPSDFTMYYDIGEGEQLTLDVATYTPFALKEIPSRKGYEFKGLYTETNGRGVQYVDENGMSTKIFTDDTVYELYAHFVPREYVMVLGCVGGTSSSKTNFVRVKYGESIPQLPTDVEIPYGVFKGWYTEPDCGGTCVMSASGKLNDIEVNYENFNIINDSNILLYAGYGAEQCTVTFAYAENSGVRVVVDRFTPFKDINIDSKIVGRPVYSWSKEKGDVNEMYLASGMIDHDITLYPTKYCKKVSFEGAYDQEIKDFYWRKGETYTIKDDSKLNKKFAYWVDQYGNKYLGNEPDEDITLSPVWYTKLTFDGLDNVIEAMPGDDIELPSCEKDGYIFVGWVDDTVISKLLTNKMPEYDVTATPIFYKASKTKEILNLTQSAPLEPSYDIVLAGQGIDFTYPIAIKIDYGVQIDSSSNFSVTCSLYDDPSGQGKNLLFTDTKYESSGYYSNTNNTNAVIYKTIQPVNDLLKLNMEIGRTYANATTTRLVVTVCQTVDSTLYNNQGQVVTISK